MKALILEEFKSDFQIKDIDKPIPGIGEVLVRIKAIGINRLDRNFKIFLLKILKKLIKVWKTML